MCFSAPASFVASGSLGIIGVGSLKTASKGEKLLAIFPFIFSIQQALEGVQWLYLARGEVSLFAGYGFLFFAYAFWPIYVPVAVYAFSKEKKKILKWMIYVGALVALFFLILLFLNPLYVRMAGYSISYDVGAPFPNLALGAYFLAVFVPLFASGNRFMRWFGALNIVFVVVAGLIYTETFASVWCFFAAISSAVFFIYLKHRAKIKRLLGAHLPRSFGAE